MTGMVQYPTMYLKEQRILGIESSGFSISVGLMEKSVPKGLIFLNDGTPGSQALLSTIDRLLRVLKVDKWELDGICVTMGPGSFTSLRISLATAEAMGIGLNIPVYGVNTLVLMANSVPYYPFRVKVIQNAYKGELYTASYDNSQGKPKELTPLSLVTPDDFYAALEKNDLILGNGIDRLRVQKYDLAKNGIRWNNDFQRTVSGIGVIEYFLETEVKKPSQIPLEPIYIRLSEAEMNYSKQFGER